MDLDPRKRPLIELVSALELAQVHQLAWIMLEPGVTAAICYARHLAQPRVQKYFEAGGGDVHENMQSFMAATFC